MLGIIGWIIVAVIVLAIIAAVMQESEGCGTAIGCIILFAFAYSVLGWGRSWFTSRTTTANAQLVDFGVSSRAQPQDSAGIPSSRRVHWSVTIDNESEKQTINSIRLRLDLKYCLPANNGAEPRCTAENKPRYESAAFFINPGVRLSDNGFLDINGVPTGHYVTGRITLDHACTDAEKRWCK